MTVCQCRQRSSHVIRGVRVMGVWVVAGCCAGSCSCPLYTAIRWELMKGGRRLGPSMVDWGKAGSKHHMVVEAHDIPLAAMPTGANRNGVTRPIPPVQAAPPIRGTRGRPLRRPRSLYGDLGHDHEIYRDKVRRIEITVADAQGAGFLRARRRSVVVEIIISETLD